MSFVFVTTRASERQGIAVARSEPAHFCILHAWHALLLNPQASVQVDEHWPSAKPGALAMAQTRKPPHSHTINSRPPTVATFTATPTMPPYFPTATTSAIRQSDEPLPSAGVPSGFPRSLSRIGGRSPQGQRPERRSPIVACSLLLVPLAPWRLPGAPAVCGGRSNMRSTSARQSPAANFSHSSGLMLGMLAVESARTYPLPPSGRRRQDLPDVSSRRRLPAHFPSGAATARTAESRGPSAFAPSHQCGIGLPRGHPSCPERPHSMPECAPLGPASAFHETQRRHPFHPSFIPRASGGPSSQIYHRI